MRARMRRGLITTLAATLAPLGLTGVACGDLDDVTTVKDLRVLAVKDEPAGILVDLDQPALMPDADLRATLTALVVDPRGDGQTLTYFAAGCPDYIDTITAATGTQSKICPSPDATSEIPAPIGPALTT